MRVLIADDDPLIVRLIEANIKRWGHEVVSAKDGLEALALLEADPSLRLVITDWMMPGIDGVELCRRIREMEGRDYTYVMLLTAKDQTEDLIHAFQAGVDEFVHKPFRARELQMRLEAAKRLLIQMSKRGIVSGHSRNPDRGQLVGGRYRLTRLLGAGGMGTVWEAIHETLGCSVAVKFLRPEQADQQVARSRFETEARAAARLASPHAVRVFDFGSSDDGVPYLVMEHLRGNSLADALAQNGPFSPQNVAKIIGEVASALTRAHALGIIHRDVKPENILLAEDEVVPGVVTTKLIDFGVAKVATDDLGPSVEGAPSSNRILVTQEGTVVGTPHFMSPEYLAGNARPDAKLDLWGLAACAYAAMVGALPFDGETVWAVIRNVCASPIPIPSQHNRDVPPGFDQWFARACARDPNDRFETADELARSLELVCAFVGERPKAPAKEDDEEVDNERTTISVTKERREIVPATDAPRMSWRMFGGVMAITLIIVTLAKIVIAG